MKQWKRGSYTVEAAFLVPVAVMLTALLIVYTFYVHNKVWYTAAACEAALEGSGRLESSGLTPVQAAGKKAEERAEQQVMPGTRPEIQTDSGSWGTRVAYRGGNAFFLKQLFTYTVEVTAEKIRPVSYLYMLWTARQLKNSVFTENSG